MDATLPENVLAEEQTQLSQYIQIPASPDGYFPKSGDTFIALDIQYHDDDAHVAADVWKWPDTHKKTFAGWIKISVPYVPSYFCFREGPPLLALVQHLMTNHQIHPDLLVIDGHGLAHPRKFGVACWLGIALKKPSIGCAKDTLIHYDITPEKKRGQRQEIYLNGEAVGYVLVTQDNTRPIFVSPGHLVSLPASADIVMSLPGQYRIVDPIRNADHAAREHEKGICDGTWQDVGPLQSVLPWWKTNG